MIKLEFEPEEIELMIYSWLQKQYPDILVRVKKLKRENIYIGDYSLNDESVYANVFVSIDLEEA